MRSRINPISAQPPRFFSVQQVADLLGTSAMTIYRAIEAGEFPAVRIRGRWIVPAKALDDIEAAAVNDGAAVDVADFAPGVA